MTDNDDKNNQLAETTAQYIGQQDTNGVPFDPSIHRTRKDGVPQKSKSGGWVKIKADRKPINTKKGPKPGTASTYGRPPGSYRLPTTDPEEKKKKKKMGRPSNAEIQQAYKEMFKNSVIDYADMPMVNIWATAFIGANGPRLLKKYFAGDLDKDHPISRTLNTLVKWGEREYQIKQQLLAYDKDAEPGKVDSNTEINFNLNVPADQLQTYKKDSDQDDDTDNNNN